MITITAVAEEAAVTAPAIPAAVVPATEAAEEASKLRTEEASEDQIIDKETEYGRYKESHCND